MTSKSGNIIKTVVVEQATKEIIIVEVSVMEFYVRIQTSKPVDTNITFHISGTVDVTEPDGQYGYSVDGDVTLYKGESYLNEEWGSWSGDYNYVSAGLSSYKPKESPYYKYELGEL